VDLNKAGLYYVAVTAEDEAGNVSDECVFYIRVYGPDEIVAVINGENVYPGSAIFTDTTKFEIEFDNMTENEPYSIRWKKGYKTTAQMKIGYEMVENGIIEHGTNFVLPGDGYYTVHVRTQSREELVFYILIMQ
jgi:hypothetical protein